MSRLLVIGGSGAGTSTLGRALATELASQQFDTDDFFWHPTDPPFARKRPEAERLALMEAVFLPRASWVLSGSLIGWGEAVIPRLTHAVLLTLPPEVRLARLKAREAQRYGDRIAPGGDLAGEHRDFLDWAAGFDDPDFAQRSLRRTEAWLAALPCPVLRLEGGAEPAVLARTVRGWLDRTPRPD